MIDREKVIKGLECCAVPGGNCEECPYQHSGVGEYFESKCVSKLSADALALLKAHEKKEGPCENCQEFTCDDCKIREEKHKREAVK